MPKLLLILMILTMLTAQVAGFSLHLCNVCESHLGSLWSCVCDEHGHSRAVSHEDSHDGMALLAVPPVSCQEKAISQPLLQPGLPGQAMMPLAAVLPSITDLVGLLDEPILPPPGCCPLRISPLSPRLLGCIWLV